MKIFLFLFFPRNRQREKNAKMSESCFFSFSPPDYYRDCVPRLAARARNRNLQTGRERKKNNKNSKARRDKMGNPSPKTRVWAYLWVCSLRRGNGICEKKMQLDLYLSSGFQFPSQKRKPLGKFRN